ncbi:condensation domain-containing protein [Dactylosporangium sp. CA-139066]|uniref:condensation domain-containing protein n=1 Tax=Dactylosporangium sp. CA-139066 TaxID=3239930 RepID=UPI003D8FC370
MGADDALEPTAHLIVAFSAARSGTADLTWAQQTIWDLSQLSRPRRPYFNFGRLVRVPAGRAPADVADALRVLFEECEAFRTTVRPGADGRPGQHVADRGEVRLAVHEVGDRADAAAERLSYEYKGHCFADEELPVRVAIITAADVPVYVLLMISHLAVDRWGADLATGRLVALLDGRGRAGPGGGGRQPLDQARAEATAAGARTADRAVAHWRRSLDAVPQSMFPDARPLPDVPWSPAGELTSRALALASGALAGRHGVSRSATILAATAALLGTRAGTRTVALQVVAANRPSPPLRAMVGTCAQMGLFVVDLPDHSFGELIERSWTASLAAYRHARYPPARVQQVLDEISVRRGVFVDLSCHFQDATVATGQPSGTARDIAADEVARAVDLSRYRRNLLWDRHQRLRLDVLNAPAGALTLSLGADPSILDAGGVEMFVRGIERLLVHAVAADPDLSEVPALTGIEPIPRGGQAVLIDSCWVDPAAVERLLCELPFVVAARVQLDRAGGEYRVTGHVAVDRDDIDPERLHRACLARLRHTPDTRAPDRYVVHRLDGETGANDPAGHAFWRDPTTIRRAGDGRGGTADDM